MKNISITIKERRKALKLTQIEVSTRAGVAKNSCRRIEACSGYNIKTLIAICDVLDLRIEIVNEPNATAATI